ncbi:adhesion protein FadA [Fusobacterium sp.]|uniref:adhesion protein FadA n=1 Tax=Fusobacterium sp. TaxID=68766 RepID=UPI0029014035|nr:adhesion protein FadA [Fusobacterium sp.]MDU1910252.1 adhesion protein FadA [Fusobacterium sp.]
MKIKTTMLLGAALLLVSSVSLAAPTPAVDSRFSQLEAELKMLEQKENERFKEEEQIAKSAQNNLNVLTNLRNKCGERINYMTSMEGRSIYSNEMKNLLKQYQGFLTEIDKQAKVEERKIFEFNQLKSLRAE